MGQNDKVLLDQVIQDRKQRVGPEISASDFFNLFVSEELLKSYGLDYQELEAGIVDGGNDGGIDAIYAFVDGELLLSVDDLSGIRQGAILELVIIQAKQSPGYQESAITSLISTFNDLLKDESDPEDLAMAYNGKLISTLTDFREAIKHAAARFPIIRFRFFYITKGDNSQVHPNVRRRTDTLKEKISDFFSDFEFQFHFLGARDLLHIVRRQATLSINLEVTEHLTAKGEGFVCLVRLKDYFSFIIDESGQRRQNIFDANVREYEGDVDVNAAIRKTLEQQISHPNFWWLNNGITIVATKAPMNSKTLTLEDPKVVNGLQTSQEIFSFFSKHAEIDDPRLILVRIIVTADENVRNQILRATNNQIRIPSYALRATDEIHEDIEQFFSYNGLFYDRQKNYYKLQGRPRQKIVSLQYLTQAVASIALFRPNDARGRPTNLIKDDNEYKQVFDRSYDPRLFLNCANLQRKVDDFLKTVAQVHLKREKTNLRFALSYFVASMKLRAIKPTAKTIAEQLNVDEVDADFIRSCADHVWDVYRALRKSQRLPGDRIAKNRVFDEQLMNRLNRVFSGATNLRDQLEFQSIVDEASL